MGKGFKTGGKNFQKGVSPNPDGRPPMDESVRRIRIETKEAVAKLYWDCVNRTKLEMTERINANPTVFEEGILRAILKDMTRGQTITLEKLMDRVIGKPKEVINITGDIRTESTVNLELLSVEEIKSLLLFTKKASIKNDSA